MTEVIRIIAVVVDTQRLTLYKTDGSTIEIPQGDPRIRALVDKVVPELEATKPNSFCDLQPQDLQLESFYTEAEASMNGFVRFFRMVKKSAEEIIDRFTELQKPVAPISAGQVPNQEEEEEEPGSRAPLTKSEAAVAEIMANAKHSSDPTFHVPSENGEETTVVAVLADHTIIPGAEKLETQLEAVANGLGSAKGLENFFRRMATVQRAHSAQDLLTFIEKGELPIADDGSVLVYKRLKTTKEDGVFVDVHSGNVRQRVGSKVFMDEKLVDPNRHQDCSNGLHVARRDYLTAFSGNVTVLAKLAPEDVIAVPHSDARKLRAKGYHIIARLSDADAALVNYNHPMSDTVLLGNAVAGNHIGVIETVEITGHEGTGLKITAWDPMETAAPLVLDQSLTTNSLDHLPQQSAEQNQVDAVKVATQVEQAKVSGKSMRQLRTAELFLALTDATNDEAYRKAGQALADFKKKAKVSWVTLGLTEEIGEQVIKVAKGELKLPEPEPVTSAPGGYADGDAYRQPTGELLEDLTGSPRQRIRHLLDVVGLTEGTAKMIVQIKLKAKKGWTALGVSPKEEAAIRKLVGE